MLDSHFAEVCLSPGCINPVPSASPPGEMLWPDCRGGSFLNLLQFVLFWGSQFWVQDLCGLTRAEEVLRSPLGMALCSPGAVPSLLPGHTGLMWSPPGCPGPFLQSCCPAAHCSLCAVARDFSFPAVRVSVCLSEFHNVPVETFFSLSRVFWRSPQHLNVTIGSPQFGTSNVLLKQYQKYLFYIFNLDCSLN